MFKKTLSLVTLVAFLLFDWACLSVQKVPVTSVNIEDQIVGVTKISGEYVQIPKENPARIVENQIVLRPSNAIALSDVKDFKQNDKGVVYEFTTKDGRTIRDIEGKREGEKIVLPPLSIPLSEVNLVWVYRKDVGGTILLILGLVVAGIGVYLILLNVLLNDLIRMYLGIGKIHFQSLSNGK
jgi:hypothetical protein